MALEEVEVPLLFVSLFLALAPVVDGERVKIWKLCELAVAALVELISLGAGLSGGGSGEDWLEGRLLSDSLRLPPPRPIDSWTFSKDVCLTLALTLPRLRMGSNDMMHGFGIEMWPTSIES